MGVDLGATIQLIIPPSSKWERTPRLPSLPHLLCREQRSVGALASSCHASLISFHLDCNSFFCTVYPTPGKDDAGVLGGAIAAAKCPTSHVEDLELLPVRGGGSRSFQSLEPPRQTSFSTFFTGPALRPRALPVGDLILNCGDSATRGGDLGCPAVHAPGRPFPHGPLNVLPRSLRPASAHATLTLIPSGHQINAQVQFFLGSHHPVSSCQIHETVSS